MEFSKKMQDYLSQKEVTGQSGKTIPLGGNAMSTINNLIAINNLFHTAKPKYTLEIGLCHAASAVLLAALHQEYNHEGYCHYAMDPFQSKGWNNIGIEQLKKFNLTNLVKFFEEYSHKTLPSL